MNSIVRLIDFPEALQVIDFADGKATLIAVRAVAGSPLVGRQIRELAVHLPDIPARIVSVFRRNRNLEISPATVIESGDEVIALAATRDIRRVSSELRRTEEPARNIIIGGNLSLARQLCESLSSRKHSIKVIEEDGTRALAAMQNFPGSALILEGNITEEKTLEDAGIDTCDLFLAMGSDDENNILSSLLAKKMGAKRVISLINRKTYADLMQGTPIDITVSLNQATLGELLRHVRRGDVIAAHSLRRGIAEALEVVAHGTPETSRVVGRTVSKVALPEGVSIGALVRGSDEAAKIIMAEPDIRIEPEDHVILFVPNKRLIPKIEELFMVDVGFF